MRKVYRRILLVVLIGGVFLIYKEFSFSPLKEKDFQRLFGEKNVGFSKSCSKDFLRITSSSELFEIYRYNIEGAVIVADYPKIIQWESKEVTNSNIIGKWRSCPVDSQAMELFSFTLASISDEDIKCCSSFNKEISISKNYYSFIHFNDLEQYFLLYCSDTKELFYIRRKGF